MTNPIDNLEDLIDVRDIIARVEELEDSRDDTEHKVWADENPSDAEELESLSKLLAGLVGTGGDEQWRGDWYPITMIRDSYFKDYAQELAEDIGAINPNAGWPNTCIDWDQAARELRMDYTAVDYDGATYWVR